MVEGQGLPSLTRMFKEHTCLSVEVNRYSSPISLTYKASKGFFVDGGSL